jgi:protein phosphatase
LLCSDGLCGFVPEHLIGEVMADIPDAAKAAKKLIDLALERGAPDNVTVVIAGVNETEMSAASKPVLVGAAAQPLMFDAVTKSLPAVTARSIFSPRSRAHEETFETADYLDTLIAEDKRRAAKRRIRWTVYLSSTLAVLIFAGIYGYVWTQSQYYVGSDADSVVVYRGVNADFGSIPLHTVVRDTGIPLNTLSQFVRTSVERTIPVLSLKQAELVVERIGNGSQSQ